MKLTIHDLCTGLARVIQYPKSPSSCESTNQDPLDQHSYHLGHTYSPDSRYLAVAERHAGKETVGVYDVGLGYQLLRVSHVSIVTEICTLSQVTAFSNRDDRYPRAHVVALRSVPCSI